MAKLSKDEARRHAEALAVLQQGILSDDDREFVFNHYHEAATNVNTVAGAFFTPLDLAWDHAMEMGCVNREGIRVIDLCAGIGVLSYTLSQRYPNLDITCVEMNPEYVEVGRVLLPQVHWHCLDVMDLDALLRLGPFDYGMSNPPFGAVPTFRGSRAPRYSGSQAEFKVIDVAADLSRYGVFILPQQSAGFRYSGQQHFEKADTERTLAFERQTGLMLENNCGIDTTAYGPWKCVNPLVELVCVDFSARLETDDERHQQGDLLAQA